MKPAGVLYPGYIISSPIEFPFRPQARVHRGRSRRWFFEIGNEPRPPKDARKAMGNDVMTRDTSPSFSYNSWLRFSSNFANSLFYYSAASWLDYHHNYRGISGILFLKPVLNRGLLLVANWLLKVGFFTIFLFLIQNYKLSIFLFKIMTVLLY